MPVFDAFHVDAGTVVVVPFPYSDRHSPRRRPALVVSSDRVAEEGMLWIAAITSVVRPAPVEAIPLADHAALGLPVRSYVRPTQIACIDPGRVLRVLGRLPKSEIQPILDRIRACIA